jgi:hypothetical protein
VANELSLDRDDVVTIMEALFDIRVKLVRVIDLLEENDEEEEAEEDA